MKSKKKKSKTQTGKKKKFNIRKKRAVQKSIPGRMKKFVTVNKILIFTVIAVVILDKFTKILIQNIYTLGESHDVIGNFFKITYIENQGIAFGIFSEWSHPLKSILLLILSIGALIFIASIFIKTHNTLIMQLSFGFIFGGAFGNIYDRLVYQRVVDFLNFGIGNWRWPFFNIADSSITVGIIIIMILTLITKEKK